MTDRSNWLMAEMTQDDLAGLGVAIRELETYLDPALPGRARELTRFRGLVTEVWMSGRRAGHELGRQAGLDEARREKPDEAYARGVEAGRNEFHHWWPDG